MDDFAGCAIAKLSPDLLHYIFEWSASSADDRLLQDPVNALYTTRSTSQVCTTWRHLILASPSLWGRILNLTFLAQKEDAWREEVLRRTGEAPLHIECANVLQYDSDGAKAMYNFLHFLIEVHWPRVKTLQLVLFEKNITEKILHLLDRPAPFLRLLRVEIEANSFVVDRPLFADHAPSCRSLRIEGFGFRMKSSWLSGLRELRMSRGWATSIYGHDHLGYDIPGVLVALQSMSNLERLDLSDCLQCLPPTNPTAYNDFATPIVLPRLRILDLYDCCRTSFDLLSHIDMHAPWKLHALITCREDEQFESERNLWPQLVDILFLYLADQLSNRLVAGLSLSNIQGTLQIHEKTELAHKVDHNDLFSICLQNISYGDYAAFLCPILQGLSTCQCDTQHITTFELSLGRDFVLGVERELVQVLSNLSSLRTLETTLAVLDLIRFTPSPSFSFLPCLTNIIFNNPDTSSITIPVSQSLLGCHAERAILHFLGRRGDSQQIEEIYLGPISSWTCSIASLVSLERFEGLRVVWKEFEDGQYRRETYICGSGSPRKLAFNKHGIAQKRPGNYRGYPPT